MQAIIAFIAGLKLSLVEWLALLLGAVAGVQSLRLARSRQREAETAGELFKTQITAGDKEQQEKLDQLDKETESARKKFEESSGAYESVRDPERPRRPSGK